MGILYGLIGASEHFGWAIGSLNIELQKHLEKTTFYQEAAFKRHAENHAIKADAMKYYADNFNSFKSMDQAAEEIAGKIVPASFRTVRKWITEYHKNLRSAGKT